MRCLSTAVAILFTLFVCAPRSWAQVSASDQEAAKAHFLAGSSYYDAANYSDAVKEFNEAYRLSKRPDLLYNIALGYERLSDFDNAISTLKRYLVEKVNAPDRNMIESRIKNLEKLRDIRNNPPIAPGTPVPEPQPQPQISEPQPQPPPATKRSLGTLGYAGIGSGSLGAVLLLSSIGTGIVAKRKSNELLDACPTRINCDPSLRSVQTQGKRLALATDVMIGVGAVALVAGVALLVVDLVRKPAAKPAPAPSSTPSTTPPAPQPAAASPPVSVVGDGIQFHF